jgi:alkanesulfonate monooxygenase SsuD/methylene tetrahydromethanopterin reductase-like flavin-dependent oxidoreductase (luciferase family)
MISEQGEGRTTKVILQVYPTVGDTTEMARRRPIGRDSDAYQAMLASLVELVQAADTLGYWGITHVEHHAHSEGLEISPDPLLLNVYLGHFTKRLMHGQLGIVVPTHDPVRLAAQIAIADHMLKGRLFVGMARGYQARWTNVVGQRFGVTSTADKSAADQRNRLLFDEHYAILEGLGKRSAALQGTSIRSSLSVRRHSQLAANRSHHREIWRPRRSR